MSGRKRRSRAPFAATVANAPPLPSRIEGIDTLRGLAILAMIAYHFAFDLRHFGALRADFENDPFWITARAAIVTSFLGIAGISLVLAHRARVAPTRFLQRVALIAACAVAASLASYVVFPQTYIYFGILHCIAVALLLARPLADRPRAAALAGLAVLVAGLTMSHPYFDARATSWIGFVTTKPPTQDYVPLFPWLGVVLLGIAAGHALAGRDFAALAPLARAPAWVRWLGRHSLPVYMAHQPVLIGALWLVLRRG
jgi:uncharacterized membrane protein